MQCRIPADSNEPVLNAEEIAAMIQRLAASIIERASGDDHRLAFVGIRRGGVPLAKRIAAVVEKVRGVAVPIGTVDVALYRDDAATALPSPKIGPSEVPFDVEGTDIVLVDDVLQTGRTIRAAIECLLDYGRPRRIWLAALCDRGGRELPIAPDFVGCVIEQPMPGRLKLSLEGPGPDGAYIV